MTTIFDLTFWAKGRESDIWLSIFTLGKGVDEPLEMDIMYFMLLVIGIKQKVIDAHRRPKPKTHFLFCRLV